MYNPNSGQRPICTNELTLEELYAHFESIRQRRTTITTQKP